MFACTISFHAVSEAHPQAEGSWGGGEFARVAEPFLSYEEDPESPRPRLCQRTLTPGSRQFESRQDMRRTSARLRGESGKSKDNAMKHFERSS